MSDDDAPERERDTARAATGVTNDAEDWATVVPSVPFVDEHQDLARSMHAVTSPPPTSPVRLLEAGARIDVDAVLPVTDTPRPVLGAALIVAGSLLWAFVVMGTFTTSWLSGGGAPLPQWVAVTLVGATTLAAWAFAVRRSKALPIQGVRSLFGRFVVVGIVAFALWVAALLVASVVGKASGANADAFIAAALLVAASLAVLMGDRMLGRSRLPRSAGGRALVLGALFWVGVVTLGACVELVAEY